MVSRRDQRPTDPTAVATAFVVCSELTIVAKVEHTPFKRWDFGFCRLPNWRVLFFLESFLLQNLPLVQNLGAKLFGDLRPP